MELLLTEWTSESKICLMSTTKKTSQCVANDSLTSLYAIKLYLRIGWINKTQNTTGEI